MFDFKSFLSGFSSVLCVFLLVSVLTLFPSCNVIKDGQQSNTTTNNVTTNVGDVDVL